MKQPYDVGLLSLHRLASYRMGIQAGKLRRLYDMEAKILAFVATANCAAAFNRLSA
jgi:hypothetical protein